jgi:hypothetical protein
MTTISIETCGIGKHQCILQACWLKKPAHAVVVRVNKLIQDLYGLIFSPQIHNKQRKAKTVSTAVQSAVLYRKPLDLGPICTHAHCLIDYAFSKILAGSQDQGGWPTRRLKQVVDR